MPHAPHLEDFEAVGFLQRREGGLILQLGDRLAPGRRRLEVTGPQQLPVVCVGVCLFVFVVCVFLLFVLFLLFVVCLFECVSGGLARCPGDPLANCTA